MKNKNILLIIILIIFISVIYYVSTILLKKDSNETLPTYYTHAIYASDTSMPENAIADSAYAFIAKINSISRTEYRDPVQVETSADGSQTKTVYNPYTIYNISVVDNLKGNLVTNQDIELEQMGGISSKGDAYYFPEGTGLLNIGEYYILLAYAPFENGNIQINRSTSVIPLGNINENSQIQSIQNIVEANNIESVDEFKNREVNSENIESSTIEKVIEYKKAALNADNTSENNRCKYDEYYMNQ